MQQFEQKRRQLLTMLMKELEDSLRTQKLWQSQQPSELALASKAPFAIDTMNFSQWLQFIFIEKIDTLLDHDLALPSAMAIAPMASEYFKMQPINSNEIVALITRIDLIINEKQ